MPLSDLCEGSVDAPIDLVQSFHTQKHAATPPSAAPSTELDLPCVQLQLSPSTGNSLCCSFLLSCGEFLQQHLSCKMLHSKPSEQFSTCLLPTLQNSLTSHYPDLSRYKLLLSHKEADVSVKCHSSNTYKF